MFFQGPALDHRDFGNGEQFLGEEGALGEVAPQGLARPGLVPPTPSRRSLTQLGRGSLWGCLWAGSHHPSARRHGDRCAVAVVPG